MTTYELFDYGMCDFELSDGFKLYQVHTGNVMDSIYFTAPEDADADEIHEHIVPKMVRRYGRRGYGMVEEIEDVTDLFA